VAEGFAFSSHGANMLGDFGVVRKNLEFFLSHQDMHGQLPLRVGGNYPLGFKFVLLNIVKTGKPTMTIDKPRWPRPVDQNSLFIIAASDYIQMSGDLGFAGYYSNNLKNALDWNFSQDRDGDLLIEQEPCSDWMDSVKKKGKVLYTNVCHWSALKCFASIAEKLDFSEDAEKYGRLAGAVKKRIDNIFWNGSYYADFIPGGERYFSTDGNILAVLWGLAGEKSGAILKTAEEFGIANGVPCKTNYPRYPSGLESFWCKIGAIGDYHNETQWAWLGAAYALALYNLREKERAFDVLESISSVFIKYGTVHEVYDSKNRPLSRVFGITKKPEFPFAWSAGMFVYAATEILNKERQILYKTTV